MARKAKAIKVNQAVSIPVKHAAAVISAIKAQGITGTKGATNTTSTNTTQETTMTNEFDGLSFDEMQAKMALLQASIAKGQAAFISDKVDGYFNLVDGLDAEQLLSLDKGIVERRAAMKKLSSVKQVEYAVFVVNDFVYMHKLNGSNSDELKAALPEGTKRATFRQLKNVKFHQAGFDNYQELVKDTDRLTLPAFKEEYNIIATN